MIAGRVSPSAGILADNRSLHGAGGSAVSRTVQRQKRGDEDNRACREEINATEEVEVERKLFTDSEHNVHDQGQEKQAQTHE